MAAPHDTEPAAWALYLSAIRALRPEERIRLAVSMSDDLRELTRAGIRSRHPDWTDDAVARSLAEIMLGRELADAVGGARPPTPS